MSFINSATITALVVVIIIIAAYAVATTACMLSERRRRINLEHKLHKAKIDLDGEIERRILAEVDAGEREKLREKIAHLEKANDAVVLVNARKEKEIALLREEKHKCIEFMSDAKATLGKIKQKLLILETVKNGYELLLEELKEMEKNDGNI